MKVSIYPLLLNLIALIYKYEAATIEDSITQLNKRYYIDDENIIDDHLSEVIIPFEKIQTQSLTTVKPYTKNINTKQQSYQPIAPIVITQVDYIPSWLPTIIIILTILFLMIFSISIIYICAKRFFIDAEKLSNKKDKIKNKIQIKIDKDGVKVNEKDYYKFNSNSIHNDSHCANANAPETTTASCLISKSPEQEPRKLNSNSKNIDSHRVAGITEPTENAS